MPAITPPSRQGEQHRERMQVHRTPEHQRTDQVALDVVHQDGQSDHDEGGDRAQRGERHQGGDPAADHCADDGEVRAEERQHREGSASGTPRIRSPAPITTPLTSPLIVVPDVTGERGPGPQAEDAELGPAGRRCQSERSVGDPLPVLDEEEARHQAQQEPDEHLQEQRRSFHRQPLACD